MLAGCRCESITRSRKEGRHVTHEAELDGAPTVDRVETGAKASQGSSHYDSKKERFTEDGDSQSETSYEFIYEQFDGAPTIDRVEMVEKASLETSSDGALGWTHIFTKGLPERQELIGW
ncbi:hypothetical protein THAOC_09399 [Thalassiosira oceanica]|uniref:Uncharacterized protein n=1 Tax=Thalassiosira oceanica TaxID=159749 RepID=K0SSP6_THAOC|nr:hypothetical protein THAOC_09399 [Thalassiosira oceanica]|eukprot:EJK69353.1 hypothetical protein THAOC_09399 [Thalassiosira oceanica]